MLDKQLFDRFLKNECSAEERRLVLEYLKAHPDAAADFLPEQELAEAEPEGWDARRSDRAFQQIQQRLTHRTHPIIRWSLVAAAVLTVAVGIKWLATGSAKPAQQAQKSRAAEEAWLTVTETNTSSKTRKLQLPDGSLAELSPGSRISYHSTFTSEDRRLVKLEGEGQFNVVGDSRHPFTVVSGELTTTVLGTWFSVIADPSASTIRVHLYSGKVKVGSSEGIRWKTKDSAFYLQPGDELIYNKQDMLAVIRSPQHGRDQNTVASRKTNGPSTSVVHQLSPSLKPEWYMFGGQPLTQVFDQLSDYYGVQINYFPADVENRYFAGKFSKNDSLESILNDIALLHGLTLKKTEGMYVFRKKE
jgi:transmembrane sensor